MVRRPVSDRFWHTTQNSLEIKSAIICSPDFLLSLHLPECVQRAVATNNALESGRFYVLQVSTICSAHLLADILCIRYTPHRRNANIQDDDLDARMMLSSPCETSLFVHLILAN